MAELLRGKPKHDSVQVLMTPRTFLSIGLAVAGLDDANLRSRPEYANLCYKFEPHITDNSTILLPRVPLSATEKRLIADILSISRYEELLWDFEKRWEIANRNLDKKSYNNTGW